MKDNKNGNENEHEHPAREDEHLIHLWQPFSFSVCTGYDYRRRTVIKSTVYYLTRLIAQLVLNIYNRLVFGMKIKGRRNLLHLRRGAVVVCNHVHVMDCTFIDCALPHKRIYYTTLETNFKIPVARHLIRALGGVPIPTKAHCMSEFLDEMTNALKDGKLVCMYPEAVLHPYYKGLRKFRAGAFHLAQKAEVPVLPLVVTFRKPRGIRRLFKKKPCITVNILTPIPPCGDKEEMSKRAYEEMYGTVTLSNTK